MKKQKEKKFGFDKFEVAKLSTLKKTIGGTGDILTNNGNDDPGGITDIIKKLSSDKCV
ncbi:hypothetical protein GOQ30_01035 [Flavobacterium sp. TP390]|uniref:Uncharacterized protein n=1 Tax=Flavobacterium profundi TaxID=1774945 RepID=A0A6I4IDQ8_9FLAO|nr:hypothetical protein [Flavobacterium profundi]MVO07744.1 hypothetical protein [Flavobacterium profundi]